MGLKSGSRDAGLDDADDADDEPAALDESEPQDVASESASTDTTNNPETDDANSEGPREQPAPTEQPSSKPAAKSETARTSMTQTTPNPTTEQKESVAKPNETEQHAEATSDTTRSTSTTSSSSDNRPVMSSIPYKMRREKVTEGRDQVPFFLRKEIIDAEDDLQDELEAQLGEHVYKSDYREAAMVVAQRHPKLVAEVLREWGYDLDAA